MMQVKGVEPCAANVEYHRLGPSGGIVRYEIGGKNREWEHVSVRFFLLSVRIGMSQDVSSEVLLGPKGSKPVPNSTKQWDCLPLNLRSNNPLI